MNMKYRKSFVPVFLLLLILMISISITTKASTTTTQALSDFEIFFNTWLSSMQTTLSWITLVAGVIIPSLYTIVFHKKFKATTFLFAFLLFIILSIYNALMILPAYEITTTIFIVLTFLVFSLFYLRLVNKYESLQSLDNPDVPQNKRVYVYIRRKIAKSHPDIKSIQLYSWVEERIEKQTKFHLEYLFGSVKKDIDINAILNTNLSISNDEIDRFRAVMDLYRKYNTPSDDSSNTITCYGILSEIIPKYVEEIRSKLATIQTADEISTNECCLARILITYISLQASIIEENCFIGLERNSLGLGQESDIEQALFTKKRTGMLSPIILGDFPYVFYYMKDSEKNGRTYFTFSCAGQSKNYLVLIAIRNSEGTPNMGIGTIRALESIENELTKIIEKHEKDVGGKKNEIEAA